jgi:hypothetical protein
MLNHSPMKFNEEAWEGQPKERAQDAFDREEKARLTAGFFFLSIFRESERLSRKKITD